MTCTGTQAHKLKLPDSLDVRLTVDVSLMWPYHGE
jgi:hypothetical protein